MRPCRKCDAERVTLDCREQRHATAVYGCKDDGAGCLCWCHDFPSMNRRKEVAADG